jgi:hypothetical protein
MSFRIQDARQAAKHFVGQDISEVGLVESFAQVCQFLADNPERQARASNVERLSSKEGLDLLAQQYFSAFRKSAFPGLPGTTPDAMVQIVLQIAFDLAPIDTNRIEREHQLAMSAENAIGALLERYLDSVLRPKGWHWCCGNHVRAVDFVRKEAGTWLMLQIKNRDNSENSSSSAIRSGTAIQKWFRSFSRTGGTNWDNLPALMQGHGLSEEGFIEFVNTYLSAKKTKRAAGN